MRAKALLLVAIAIAIGVGLAFAPRFPQAIGYHFFADRRTLLGIPNALNVLSNGPFAVVGVLGAAWLGSAKGRQELPAEERLAYRVFFAGVFLTAFGSSYYHLAPSTPRLFWDRLPMTIGFTALFTSVVAERIDPRAARLLLGPLVITGIASVLVWRWSEEHHVGDLRFYAFVQGFPIVALPVMMLLFPARYTRGRELIAVVALYALAKLLETFDGAVWRATFGLVSGHSLKHLAAAGSTYAVLDMLSKRTRR